MNTSISFKWLISLFLLVYFFEINSLEEEFFPNHTSPENTQKLDIYISNIQRGLDYLQEKFSYLEIQDREKIIELFIKLRLKELENFNYYQVITSQDSQYFAYQVIAKELHKKLYGEMYNNFEFLRYPNDSFATSLDDLFQKYPFLKEGVKKHMGNQASQDDITGIFDDTSPEVSREILSVSLSMETIVSVDSSFFVFVWGKGISDWSNSKKEEIYRERFVQHISEIFESAGISKIYYKPYLEDLVNKAPKTNEGIINQIFLPKENINKYLYISSAGGFLKSIEKIDKYFEQFQENRLYPNFNIHENIQARVIVGTLFDNYVSIFRYTLIPEEEQEIYKIYVSKILDLILASSCRKS